VLACWPELTTVIPQETGGSSTFPADFVQKEAENCRKTLQEVLRIKGNNS